MADPPQWSSTHGCAKMTSISTTFDLFYHSMIHSEISRIMDVTAKERWRYRLILNFWYPRFTSTLVKRSRLLLAQKSIF